MPGQPHENCDPTPHVEQSRSIRQLAAPTRRQGLDHSSLNLLTRRLSIARYKRRVKEINYPINLEPSMDRCLAWIKQSPRWNSHKHSACRFYGAPGPRLILSREPSFSDLLNVARQTLMEITRCWCRWILTSRITACKLMKDASASSENQPYCAVREDCSEKEL